MRIKTAAVSFPVERGQPEANLARAAALLRQAAAGGARLIVMPELWNTGYDLAHGAALAQGAAGPAVTMLRETAGALGVCIVGGSVIEKKQGKYYNTMFVAGADGNILCKYRKAHLFPHGLEEHLFFSPGDELVRFDLELAGESVCVGAAICYDLRFPELFRNLALRGAKLFAVPAYWPAARRGEFELFCRSRAAENRCFLVAANDAPGAPSLIVSPEGDVLAASVEAECLLYATLDLSILDSGRLFNAIADRQPFIDEIDDNLL